MAMHYHSSAIAYQDGVDCGLGEQTGESIVVASDHRELAVLAFRLVKTSCGKTFCAHRLGTCRKDQVPDLHAAQAGNKICCRRTCRRKEIIAGKPKALCFEIR